MEIEKNESYYFQIEDFLEHKKYILESASILIKYLLETKQDDLAFELLKRISIHDNSKLENEEFSLLCKIPLKKDSFINANCNMEESLKNAIQLHWKNNEHHPEHFENIEDMKEVDILEMCCDWYARSLQYHTNFLVFVKTRQENRFHFPKKMFNKIWKYCLILNKGKTTSNK